MSEVDLVIPVYNEGPAIYPMLDALLEHVRFDYRIYICHDHPDDTTVAAIHAYPDLRKLPLSLIQNEGEGVCDAIFSGIRAGKGAAVIVMPADDTFNAALLNEMAARFSQGAQVVCPSRFMSGGCMTGCPWFKSILVRTAAFTLYHVARLPTHDPTNGFRLFSRRLLQSIPVEASEGFAFSLELLVKAHRRGIKIAELPAQWHERQAGKSRFRLFHWLPLYLRWYVYAFFGRPEQTEVKSMPQEDIPLPGNSAAVRS